MDAILKDNTMDTVIKGLFEYYLENDEVVYLAGDGFEIPIQLSIVKCYIPVMKAALETPLNEETRECQQRKCIRISDFDKFTVETFVNSWDPKKSLKDLQWTGLVKLVKFCHFYQVQSVFSLCVVAGIKFITTDTFFEAIEMIDTYDIEKWMQQSCDVCSKEYECLREDDRWKMCLTKYSNTLVSVLDRCFARYRQDGVALILLKDFYSCITNVTCLCFCGHSRKHIDILKSDILNEKSFNMIIKSKYGGDVWNGVRQCVLELHNKCTCNCQHIPKHFDVLKNHLKECFEKHCG